MKQSQPFSLLSLRQTVALLFLLTSLSAGAWNMAASKLTTEWGKYVTPENVWPEYPRPQMVRPLWQNLNGLWDYQALDSYTADLSESWTRILVPFAPEAPLSGIGQHSESQAYRRTFTIDNAWKGKRVLLHFEAVDWRCEAFVNGVSVGSHEGGYDPFTFDITDALTAEGEQTLLLRVYDPTDHEAIPRGKQVLNPGGIFYTCSSGIWQTVWLEAVEQSYIADFRIVPDVDAGTVQVSLILAGGEAPATFAVQVRKGDTVVSEGSGATTDVLTLSIPDAELWTPDHPFLYDLTLTCGNDVVESYFGMRKISLKKDADGWYRLMLNNAFVFQMGPLDQGYWPDGIYTAPSDEALRSDIVVMKKMGFNMVRKHIKVEPRRWYYWCDRMGLMVWQDMPGENYGGVGGVPNDGDIFGRELTAMVNTHFNSPSIIMWVIFNEGGGQDGGAYTNKFVTMVRRLDSTRLINEASGWVHYGYGDVKDIHPYPAPSYTTTTKKQATACGEYGGVKYALSGHVWSNNSWGYATVNSPGELDDIYTQYARKLAYYKTYKGLSAAVYTQITDVEVEVNGLMSYDRVVKSDINRLYRANRIAIEEEGEEEEYLLRPADIEGETWSYTTTRPADDWMQPTFNAEGWRSGKGGFGANGPANMKYGTSWTSSDIWIRREVTLNLTPEELSRLKLHIYHDEDTEVWFNGVKGFSATGYLTDYADRDISAEALAAIDPQGTNVIAAHCHQTTGGQFIDIALYVEKPGVLGRTERAVRLTLDYDRSSELTFTAGWASDPSATQPEVTRTWTYLPFTDSRQRAVIGLDDTLLAEPEELLFDVSSLVPAEPFTREGRLFFTIHTPTGAVGSGHVTAALFEDAAAATPVVALLTTDVIDVKGGTPTVLSLPFPPTPLPDDNPAEALDFSVGPSVLQRGDEVFLEAVRDDIDALWTVSNGLMTYYIDGTATSLRLPYSGNYSVTLTDCSTGISRTDRHAFAVSRCEGGNALSFGSGATLTFAHPLTGPCTRFTCEWWMNIDDDGTFAIREQTGGLFAIETTPEGRLHVVLDGNAVLSPEDFVICGGWHHYAVVYYNSKLYFFCDGVQQAVAATVRNTPAWPGDVTVEGNRVLLDEFRFWDYRLTSSQIVNYASAPIADVVWASTSHRLAACYSFNEEEGHAVDATPARRTGVIDGDAARVPSQGMFSLPEGDGAKAKNITSTTLTNYRSPFLCAADAAIPGYIGRFYTLETGTERSTWQGNVERVVVDAWHNKGLSAMASWCGMDDRYPDSRLWQTVTLPAGLYTFSVTSTLSDGDHRCLLMACAGDAFDSVPPSGSSEAPSDSPEGGVNSLPIGRDGVGLSPLPLGEGWGGAVPLPDGSLTFLLTEESDVSLGVLLRLRPYARTVIKAFSLTSEPAVCLKGDGRTLASVQPLPADTPAAFTLTPGGLRLLPTGASVTVCTPDGRLLLRRTPVTEEQILLPTGIYLVGGKRVLVR
jgi:hypothetical protein